MSHSPYNYKAGLRNVGSYQASGLPYVTGGLDASVPGGHSVGFPAVTRWFVVSNLDPINECRVAFSQNGVLGTEYFRVQPSGSSERFEMRVTQVFLSGSNSVDVMAGLTSIDVTAINNANLSPSGSNWSGSVGVQVG
jgi:hypothetical protein